METVTSFRGSSPVSSYSTVMLYIDPEPRLTHTVKVIGTTELSPSFAVVVHFKTPTPEFSGKPVDVSLSWITWDFVNTALSTRGCVLNCAPDAVSASRLSLILVIAE